jgi:uncharacterized protein YrrD
MKQSVRDLKGDRILAADGVIGFIQDVYFDEDWRVRYLAVDIGALLPGRRVMIRAAALEEESMSDPNGTTVRVKLTREEIRTSRSQLAPGDSDLRSGRELMGYGIQARDGPAGELQDLIVDEKTRAISDVVIDTRKWWPGGHVRVAPQRVERIDAKARKVLVRMSVKEIRARSTFLAQRRLRDNQGGTP